MLKINDGLTNEQRYRMRNIEKCRAACRKCQIKLNNKKRFGGLRFKILERDDYQCQICGKNISAKNMACIHHKDENKTNNIMKNLISLCKSCHPKAHYNNRKFDKKHQFK